MTEQEILDALEKLNEATADELAEYIDISPQSVRNSLRRLLKETEIEKIILTKEEVISKGVRFTGRHYQWKLKKNLKNYGIIGILILYWMLLDSGFLSGLSSSFGY